MRLSVDSRRLGGGLAVGGFRLVILVVGFSDFGYSFFVRRAIIIALWYVKRQYIMQCSQKISSI